MRRLAPPALAALALLAGCGDDSTITPARTTGPAPDARQLDLGRAPAAAGEVVVRGDRTPATHGPYELDGRYRVRLERRVPDGTAPEDAGFSALLVEAPAGRTATPIRLFGGAGEEEATTVTARGRYVVEVALGEGPYVLRLTPVRRP